MLACFPAAPRPGACRPRTSPSPDRTIDEGDVIHFGSLRLQVIHTPGTPLGGVFTDRGRPVCSWATPLFAGSVGRTDFPGRDFDTLKSSIQKSFSRWATR